LPRSARGVRAKRPRSRPRARRRGGAARDAAARPAAQRIAPILERLAARFPDATCALHHQNPLELLVATILSAQCTDARVNLVTKDLFQRYRTAQDYAAADPRLFERQIMSTGFFRNKTRSVLGMAQALVDRHQGQVPDTMEELVALPGVGRKTANVILGTAFGKNEGVVVDTHVTRIARRLRLTRQREPEKIERDLMKLVPREQWTDFGHRLIHFGREICDARKPLCEACPVSELCPSSLV
jgi:endonuclease-3